MELRQYLDLCVFIQDILNGVTYHISAQANFCAILYLPTPYYSVMVPTINYATAYGTTVYTMAQHKD